MSLEHDGALIGGNGRNIKSISNAGKYATEENVEKGKKADFVGHSWTLRREYLRVLMQQPFFTFTSAEDITLSFALQKVGIESWTATAGIKNINGAGGPVASYKKPLLQDARQKAFCQIIEQGFKPGSCSNCDKENAKSV